ncbi:hypothetical protein SPONN_2612 [uncultured Candidatus Thioglobus sp.]|nr:hypothetical protein SPONN_2612 [uncultured Candidatus Thioglobus sp.]
MLVLENYFNFPAKQHTQAIGFLLNRRGFTFLEEDYSKESLNDLPDNAWQNLSVKVQELLSEQQGIADKLMDLATNCPEQITDIFNAIQEIDDYQTYQKEKETINKEFIYFDYIEKINKACDLVNQDKEVTDKAVELKEGDKKHLSKTAHWIVERLNKEIGSNFVIPEGKYQIDLTSQINSTKATRIQKQLPDFEEQRVAVKYRKTINAKSLWDFTISKFEFNSKNEKGLEENKEKTHLHHLCYAVYKINHEIISGARHRSTYFEEIQDDLENFSNPNFLDNKHSPKYLINFINEITNHSQLNIDKLHKLVCHISNFELKPLRAYFNDKTPIKRDKNYKKENTDKSNFISHVAKNGGDQFNNEKLTRLASIWFMKNWRVDLGRDKQGKVDSYKELKEQWQDHHDKNDIIAFWLKTDPVLTIPPYQNMNNRKPPKCQTLVLNSEYLNHHYPDWRDWLDKLKPDQKYQEKLQELESGKGPRTTKAGKKIDGRLISDDSIKLRQLQFILDTAKKVDKYKLNEIWSIHHQLQKPTATDENQLKTAIKDSTLPECLKKDLEFSSESSFKHFINKYYQTRRKARDGRYFLIQVKKEKWLTKGKLLTLCTHKPWQKKHQWKIDLAAVFGIDKEELEDKLTNTDGKEIAPEDYFKDIKGCCEKSAKAQKDHRGELKYKIGRALARSASGEKLPKGEAKDLSNLAANCYKSKTKLIEITGIDGLLADIQTKENDQKIALVFKFAQINNIIFKERSGFSKTCPVCSTDNAFRMQKNDEGIARASRLPALSIRLIDGVVMRICDAISRHVASTKWNHIKSDLKQGKEVHLPLIFEQNRFEFEPSLAKIKGRTIKLNDDRDDQFNDKNKRIKAAASGISAYSGREFSDGEIDHIIPQSSKYGTLNDEANLIYLSNEDNQFKSNKTKSLVDLHQNYKNKIFGGDTKTDEEIKQFIYDKLIGENKKPENIDKDDDNFSFGKYLSFINLEKDVAIAFRHALFLDGDPLKQKVINALQNRNRTIVNGTQRYLAQCIADKIHRSYRKENPKGKLEFDYFEYTAKVNEENSTTELRKYFEGKKAKLSDGLLIDISKKTNEKQKTQSHLIDAQMAFLLAAYNHQDDGSMGLKFDKLETIKQGDVSADTGEYNPTKFFDASLVGENDYQKVELNPKSSNEKIVDIENRKNNKKQNLSKIFKRYVFKENAIGERYKPIVEFNGKMYLGYPMTIKGGIYRCDGYCKEITTKSGLKNLQNIINDDKYYKLTIDNEQIKIWTIKTVDKKYKQIDKDSHKYFSKLNPQYTDDEKQEIEQIKFILGACKYYVSRYKVENAPGILAKFAEYNEDNKEWVFKKNVKYPFYQNWIDFDKAWRGCIKNAYKVDTKGQYDLSDDEAEKKWKDFCKKRFSPPKNQLKNKHRVKGKKYTMISSGIPPGAVFRINRNNQDIYQAISLDTTIIGKNKSSFLIKHSKNLTLNSPTADKDLNKEITLEITNIDLKIDNIEDIFQKDFIDNKEIKTQIELVKASLTNNQVAISNFPVSIFKDVIDNFSKWEEGNSILFKQSDDRKPKANNGELKKIIKLPYRFDGKSSIKDITIKDDFVDFKLSCKKDIAHKFKKNLENNSD